MPRFSAPVAVPGALSRDSINTQLERVLGSKVFARSPRISRFLKFVVEQTLDRHEDTLKEYLLGVEVFGRADSFDPRVDSIVRVEARRLRFKLERYYQTEGRGDTVHIQFRKGCYVPFFGEKRAGDPGSGSSELDGVPFVIGIEDPHVFALHARGRACLARASASGVAEAISCFAHAVKVDCTCAPAHSGLATAWMISSALGLMPARDLVPKASSAAMAAQSLTSSSSEAQAIIGIASAVHDLDWAGAEPRLRKAIVLNPWDLGARLWYALYLVLVGRPEDGTREARKAQQAAPEWPAAHLAAGFAMHAAGWFEEAMRQYRLAQDLDPSFWVPGFALGLLHADRGMPELALDVLNRVAQTAPNNPLVMAAIAVALSAAGQVQRSRRVRADIAQLAREQYVCPFAQALAMSATGEVDGAFRMLESALDERTPWLATIRFLSAFESVRRDPRYRPFLRRLRLP